MTYIDKDIGIRVDQRELVCGECPIETGCDEGSLFCLYRFLTNPNAAQQPFIGIFHKVREQKFNDAEYREAHREEKRQYDRERYAAKREQG